MEGMDGFFDIFSIMIACYGLYFLFTWFRTTVLKKPLDTKNLLPGDLTMATCSDPDACTAYLMRWMIITGVSLVIYAAASYLYSRETWFMAVILGYFAVILTYYLLTMRAARRRFWPDTVKGKKEK